MKSVDKSLIQMSDLLSGQRAPVTGVIIAEMVQRIFVATFR